MDPLRIDLHSIRSASLEFRRSTQEHLSYIHISDICEEATGQSPFVLAERHTRIIAEIWDILR